MKLLITSIFLWTIAAMPASGMSAIEVRSLSCNDWFKAAAGGGLYRLVFNEEPPPGSINASRVIASPNGNDSPMWLAISNRIRVCGNPSPWRIYDPSFRSGNGSIEEPQNWVTTWCGSLILEGLTPLREYLLEDENGGSLTIAADFLGRVILSNDNLIHRWGLINASGNGEIHQWATSSRRIINPDRCLISDDDRESDLLNEGTLENQSLDQRFEEFQRLRSLSN